MAAKRKLPKPGEVLIVSIGEPVGRPQILPLDGEVAAYVFAQPGDESRYHMVSWRDHPPDAALAASTTATRRAAPADRPEAIFSAVDVALDWRQSEIRFTVVSPGDDIAVEAAKLHEIALTEAIEPSKASEAAAAGYQPLDFETFDHAENGEGPGMKAAK